MRPSTLCDLNPSIAKEFGCGTSVFEEDLENLHSLLYKLIPSDDSDAIEVFGYTLLLLSETSLREDLPFRFLMSQFHDRLLMGRDFELYGTSLIGVEKKVGRQVLQLVRSMSDSQLKLFIEWEYTAIRGPSNKKLSSVIETMKETHQWIGGVLAARH